MADHWFPKSIAQETVAGGYTITLTTDTPCHLWLYWTDKEPWVHRRSTIDRGLTVPWASYWCYVAWHKIEQNEAGDTYIHTYNWLGWETCQTKWFTFHGQIAGIESPSGAPILHKHYIAPPPPPPPTTMRLITYRDFVTQQPLAIETRTVENNGIIVATPQDTLIFQPWGAHPTLIHVSADVYMIVYAYQSAVALKALTYTITPQGDITDTPIATLTIDAVRGTMPQVLNISGNIYAVCYRGEGDDGFIKTFTCTPTGILGPVIASFEFDTVYCDAPNFIHIAGTTYAVVNTGDRNDGYLRTIQIRDDGIIPGQIDAWEFDPYNGYTINLIHVAGTVYAIFCDGGYNGAIGSASFFLKTLNISDAGVITKSFIDALIKNFINMPCAIIRGPGNYFILKMPGPDYTASIIISDAGDIAADYTSTSAISGTGLYNISPGYFATFYGAYLRTFSIDADGILSPTIDQRSLSGYTLYEPEMITLG